MFQDSFPIDKKEVYVRSAQKAYSSLYDCHSPSGNTPSGKKLATGMLGGSVCSAFFLPEVESRVLSELFSFSVSTQLCGATVKLTHSWFSSSFSLQPTLPRLHSRLRGLLH